MTNHKPLNVVAAIIENPQGQLLIAERPADKAWAGYWEFPGGKIEPGESHEAAPWRGSHPRLLPHPLDAGHRPARSRRPALVLGFARGNQRLPLPRTQHRRAAKTAKRLIMRRFPYHQYHGTIRYHPCGNSA